MQLNEKQAQVLGLSRKDRKILSALAEPIHISALAGIVGFPRTSLYSMLLKLEKRRLVVRKKYKNKKEWSAIDETSMSELLKKLYEDSRSENEKSGEKIILKHSPATGFTLYRGTKNLISLYEKMLALNRHERLMILQPNRSTETVFKKFPADKMVGINRYIQKNKIIVEAVLHENAISHYLGMLKKEKVSKTQMRTMMKSFENRVADTTYIPSDLLDFISEIYIMGKSALLMNWQEEVGIEIQNPDMVGMLRGMFEFIKHFGKKVDQNPMIRKILESEFDL